MKQKIWIYMKKTDKDSQSETGRELLREGLSKHYGLHFTKEELKEEVETGKNGKPYLKHFPDIHFNISHSDDYAACAVGEISCGLDIQKIKSVHTKRLLLRTLSEKEYTCVKKAAEPEKEFCKYWTLKESYLKWTGEGITKDLATLAMSGWHQHFSFDDAYEGCICAKEACEIELKIL